MGRAQATDLAKPRVQPSRGLLSRFARRGLLRDLSIVFLPALALRLLLFVQLQETLFFSAHFSDAKIYLALAHGILEGESPARAWFMSPAYPFLLAGFLRAGAQPDVWMRLLQCLLGASSASILFLIGRDAVSRRAGFAAGFLAVVYPMFLFLDNALLIESILTAIVVTHLAVVMRARQKDDTRLYAIAGALLGLLLVFRFSMVPYAVLLGVVLLRNVPAKRGVRAAIAVLGTAMLVVAPWTIRNAVVEGVFVPVASSGGYNVYAGNNADARGWYRVPEQIDIADDPNGHRHAERALGRPLNSREVSSYWFGKAWTWMTEHPQDAGALLLRKAALFFHFSEIDQTGLSIGFLQREYATVLSVPLPTFPVLLFFALLGASIAIRERLDLRLPALFFLLCLASTVLFFVNSRLRVPALPVLMLFAGVAFDAVIRAISARRWPVTSIRDGLLVYGIPVGVFCLLWAAQPAVPQTYEREYQILADQAFARSDFRGAATLFAKSLNERPNVEAAMGWGNALAASGDTAGAGPLYDKALELDPTNALVWFNRGNLAMQTNDRRLAYGNWRRAAALNPDFAPAYRNIGLLLMQTTRSREALDALLRYQQLETDTRRRDEVEQDIQALRARLADVR